MARCTAHRCGSFASWALGVLLLAVSAGGDNRLGSLLPEAAIGPDIAPVIGAPAAQGVSDAAPVLDAPAAQGVPDAAPILGAPAAQGLPGTEIIERVIDGDGTTSILIPPAILDEDGLATPEADTGSIPPVVDYLSALEAARSAAKDAQFLMQATFGPTRAALAKLQTMSYADWIREQMSLPVESHREYLRRRVNPRLPGDELNAARRSRCAKGARWANFAFQKLDVGMSVTVESNRIKVDGALRSHIDPSFVGNGMPAPNCTNIDGAGVKCSWNQGRTACYDAERLFGGGFCREKCWQRGYPHSSTDCSIGWPQLSQNTFTGYVCEVEEGVRGIVALSVSSGCETKVYMLNPGLYLTDMSTAVQPSASFESAIHPGVIVLAEELPHACELANAKWIIYAGNVYRADDRAALFDNTPDVPAVGVSGVICPNVPRTFLNEATCRIVPTCAPADTVIAAATVSLTKTTRSTFYSVGGRYVYAVAGLRTSVGPCVDVSRWQHCDASMACNASSVSAADSSKIAQALAAESGSVRDIQAACTDVSAGTVVDVGGGVLWKHVHNDEFNVFDFTEWVQAHPGGQAAITKWAINGSFVLQFPSWHEMARWESPTYRAYRQLLGKADETVLFSELPAALRTFALAKELAPASNKVHYEACGSPFEVANDPKVGHRFRFTVTEENANGDEVYDAAVDGYDEHLYGSPLIQRSSPGMIWFNVALKANDQLRQRVAWALSQIFVLSTDGAASDGKRSESYLHYYDIFVRHAFGNFRDVLREVTYSPLMGEYLTFRRSKAYDWSRAYPDENYAREVMQLFTIGLWQLNEDGTRRTDASGSGIETYNNEHVMDFSRVFTGFDDQAARSNQEDSSTWANSIDPSMMVARSHDGYPKRDLVGGYLGDGYPLCTDAPAGLFLRKGARFEFVGFEAPNGVLRVLELRATSPLSMALCDAGADSQCRHVSVRTLPDSLSCDQDECATPSVDVVRVRDGFYRFAPPPCVSLFFPTGRTYATPRYGKDPFMYKTCAHPADRVAGASCCNGGCTNYANSYMLGNNWTCSNSEVQYPKLYTTKCNKDASFVANRYCRLECWEHGVGYVGDNCTISTLEGKEFRRETSNSREYVTFQEAEDICKSLGLHVCEVPLAQQPYPVPLDKIWVPEACDLGAIVDTSGKVSSPYFPNPAHNKFWVAWADGFPDASVCASPCAITDGLCRCPTTPQELRVFAAKPSAADVKSLLKVGAYAPSGLCTDCNGDVKMYAATSSYDATTVFEVEGKFYKNAAYMVRIANNSFRNPPAFGLGRSVTERQAIAEVEAFLDHLFQHPNTPVFFARALIQRFGTSNPSGHYLSAVAEAFRTGRCFDMVFSGKYGDMGAAVAMILLHSGARSPQGSDAGSLREPLVKLVHFLRAMEYASLDGQEVYVEDTTDALGQWPLRSPSVFNFYSPMFSPPRWTSGLVAPEFQIFSSPRAIMQLDGLLSIIEHGELTSCGGHGFTVGCREGNYWFALNATTAGTGSVVDQLDLLLTGGRLNASRGSVQKAHDNATVADERFKAAQRAIVMTPEFHTFGASRAHGVRQELPQQPIAPARSYRAFIMIYLGGGADSFNMLVPMECPLWTEYQVVRREVALSSDQLHRISTPNQACPAFGVHAQLSLAKELYDAGQLAFVTNVGSLVQPTSAAEYNRKNVTLCASLFSHLDQQNAAGTLQCQTPGVSPRGVGGRMADALRSNGAGNLRTMSFSMDGNQVWSQGFNTDITIVDAERGIPRMKHLRKVQDIVQNVTGTIHESPYSDEYALRLKEGVASSEFLGGLLDAAKLSTSYPVPTSGVGDQLLQVAKLIASRDGRGTEREVFFVELGGFDTHSDALISLRDRFAELNAALVPFVAEMKALGMWDNIVMLTNSDFGRTLTPNGQGTDHAWAGNYFVMGGQVRGGHVFNDFPASLQEGAEQDIGRGRLVPKYPWENMAVPIAEWLGVQEADMSYVFPNLHKFDRQRHIISKSALFSA